MIKALTIVLDSIIVDLQRRMDEVPPNTLSGNAPDTHRNATNADPPRGPEAPHFGVQLLEALQHQADEFRAETDAIKRQQAKSHKLLA